ncbi:MAG: hypothetical protein ACLP1D_06025, partial [Xanthobacteraceae bacterium]
NTASIVARSGFGVTGGPGTVIIDAAAIAIDIVLRIRFALGLILDFGPRQPDRDKHAGLIREANDPSSK